MDTMTLPRAPLFNTNGPHTTTTRYWGVGWWMEVNGARRRGPHPCRARLVTFTRHRHRRRGAAARASANTADPCGAALRRLRRLAERAQVATELVRLGHQRHSRSRPGASRAAQNVQLEGASFILHLMQWVCPRRSFSVTDDAGESASEARPFAHVVADASLDESLVAPSSDGRAFDAELFAELFGGQHPRREQPVLEARKLGGAVYDDPVDPRVGCGRQVEADRRARRLRRLPKALFEPTDVRLVGPVGASVLDECTRASRAALEARRAKISMSESPCVNCFSRTSRARSRAASLSGANR